MTTPTRSSNPHTACMPLLFPRNLKVWAVAWFYKTALHAVQYCLNTERLAATGPGSRSMGILGTIVAGV